MTYDAESTSKRITVDGLSIHYHDTGGDRAPLILMHGGGPGASAWGNFRDNLPAFALNFRVIAVDMPHFGKSDKPADRFLDCAWYAQILAGFMEQIGVQKAHFIGNSMGGSIALELALARPAMVDRLVLMGTAGSMPMFAPSPTEGQKHMLGYYQGEGPTPAKLEAFIRSMIYDQSRITPEFLLARYEASTAPELMVERKMDMNNVDNMLNLWRHVEKVTHKTLLVYGKEDRVVPWETGLLLLRLMKQADLHVFNRCGHWAQWERAPEFNSIVSSFLLGPVS